MKIVFLFRSLNYGDAERQRVIPAKGLRERWHDVWEKFENSLIIGNGTGSSQEAVIGAPNQYLAFMQDHGLLGAIILPLLVLAAM
jgi:hypothetical protein